MSSCYSCFTMASKILTVFSIFLPIILFCIIYLRVPQNTVISNDALTIFPQNTVVPNKIVKNSIDGYKSTNKIVDSISHKITHGKYKFDIVKMSRLHQVLMLKFKIPLDWNLIPTNPLVSRGLPEELEAFKNITSIEFANRLAKVLQSDNSDKPIISVGIVSEKKFRGPQEELTLPCIYSKCQYHRVRHPSKLKDHKIIVLYTRGDQWEGITKNDIVTHIDSQNQFLVHYMTESPKYTSDWFKSFDRINVDLTLTYRWDSDAPIQIPIVIPKETISQEKINYANGRSKQVYWLNSRCVTNSKREDYARELSKYTLINIYGACGKKRCPQSAKWRKRSKYEDCLTQLTSEYKFYLSFENSRCKNYISEKFWRPLNRYNVPIVLGGMSRADYDEIAPPRSFIHIDDFASPEQLGEYINYLHHNDSAYNDYHAWRSRYDLKLAPHGTTIEDNNKHYSHWCHLCDLAAANVRNRHSLSFCSNQQPTPITLSGIPNPDGTILIQGLPPGMQVIDATTIPGSGSAESSGYTHYAAPTSYYSQDLQYQAYQDYAAGAATAAVQQQMAQQQQSCFNMSRDFNAGSAGKVRRRDGPDATYKPSKSAITASSSGLTQIVCALHGKHRGPRYLTESPLGSGRFVCKPGDECKDLTSAGNLYPCAMHGKNRNLESLVQQGDGTYVCKQTNMCKTGAIKPDPNRAAAALAAAGGQGLYSYNNAGMIQQQSASDNSSSKPYGKMYNRQAQENQSVWQQQQNHSWQQNNNRSSPYSTSEAECNPILDGGLKMCSLHNKRRSQNALELGPDGYQCIEGFKCIIGSGGGSNK